ncbi:deoxyribodipyrimidine photo-lyase [Leptobacterium sp. I13]|uniref:cryptochrome/photolyase family protein n=1 Tax=Leptobacterium meishanense TaxID=3128904 RepID=UPI0030ED1A5D
MKIAVHWFRRDLRLEDNIALSHAMQSDYSILPIFIFDEHIISSLPKDDARINFIHKQLQSIDSRLKKEGSSLLCLKGDPVRIWKELLTTYDIAEVYTNKDYEPYAIKRDTAIKELLHHHNISFKVYKDQVIFEENDVVKDDGTPYTVYTPYKNKWLKQFDKKHITPAKTNYTNLYQCKYALPELTTIGFQKSAIRVRDYDFSQLDTYKETRDFPAADTTSYLSPHLRFGTISVRQVIAQLKPAQETFLSELIWREFFMQILYHFPKVVNHSFKAKYDAIQWRNNKEEFKKWCKGETGYPLVDAGMRQLNATGYMHNRVRMVVASFLCKHLLIDWRWGEAYFAEKLLDYELSSNNGNWQWAAGTGCDAAPYFRIFNPTSQLEKFDKDLRYVKKWVPEYEELTYPSPIIDHKYARERALETYKKGIE